VVTAVVLLAALGAAGQSQAAANSATLQGSIRDSSGLAVASATVHLRVKDATRTLTVLTDASGKYSFSGLAAGSYVLHAELAQQGEAIFGPLVVALGESKIVDLVLQQAPERPIEFLKKSDPHSSAAGAPEFFDPPQFTVAGVTDPSNLGGHGSDTVVRNREALTKETVALGKESSTVPHPASTAATEESLREAEAGNPANFDANSDANYRLGKLLVDRGKANDALPYLERASRLKDKAEIHRLLGEVEEKLGDPLEAVREYQRAAELSPNESNLFDWGSELLLHRAPEPAIEVFSKGNHRFPRSVRMLVGLGVARYVRGDASEAVRLLCEASDLDPGDPEPYLFLGRIQAAEKGGRDEMADKLRRFAELRPENALANYYYAVSLSKRRKSPQDVEDVPKVESLLEKAIRLDPGLGAAYLQLGIHWAEQKDFSKAIAAYQKAIEVSPRLEEGHYRLAQVYRQTGEKLQAEKEIQIYEQTAKENAGEMDRERHDIKQFVYTLRDPGSTSQQPE
jgi:tetratricopeptide (TPR) repeat protein